MPLHAPSVQICISAYAISVTVIGFYLAVKTPTRGLEHVDLNPFHLLSRAHNRAEDGPADKPGSCPNE